MGVWLCDHAGVVAVVALALVAGVFYGGVGALGVGEVFGLRVCGRGGGGYVALSDRCLGDGEGMGVLADSGSALAKLLGAGGEEADTIRSEVFAYHRQVKERRAKGAVAAAAKRGRVLATQ